MSKIEKQIQDDYKGYNMIVKLRNHFGENDINGYSDEYFMIWIEQKLEEIKKESDEI